MVAMTMTAQHLRSLAVPTAVGATAAEVAGGNAAVVGTIRLPTAMMMATSGGCSTLLSVLQIHRPVLLLQLSLQILQLKHLLLLILQLRP
jgi:hypothetical protein